MLFSSVIMAVLLILSGHLFFTGDYTHGFIVLALMVIYEETFTMGDKL